MTVVRVIRIWKKSREAAGGSDGSDVSRRRCEVVPFCPVLCLASPGVRGAQNQPPPQRTAVPTPSCVGSSPRRLTHPESLPCPFCAFSPPRRWILLMEEFRGRAHPYAMASTDFRPSCDKSIPGRKYFHMSLDEHDTHLSLHDVFLPNVIWPRLVVPDSSKQKPLGPWRGS